MPPFLSWSWREPSRECRRMGRGINSTEQGDSSECEQQSLGSWEALRRQV